MSSQKLLVFSDDWGRHPSSCQHLVRAMLPDVSATWVNTIGMRPPRLDRLSLVRGWEKIRGWAFRDGGDGIEVPAGLTVIDARMWPWMTHRWDRFLNRHLLGRQLASAGEGSVAVTTLPIVADLVGKLPVDRWVYYCVDDFSVWPGLDGRALGRMEDELVPKVDVIVAASDALAEGIRRRGREAEVLTHGVDLEFWRGAEESGERPASRRASPPRPSAVPPSPQRRGRGNLSRRGAAEMTLTGECHNSPSPASCPLTTTPDAPLVLFWGVIDRRMNAEWLLALSDALEAGEIMLAGPQQNCDPRFRERENIVLPGPVPYQSLPALARLASVLIMPYADLEVTRAMQPLKLKEYLATGRPVVVSRLPAVRGWESYLDVVDDAGEFVRRALHWVRGPTPEVGGINRPADAALSRESWKAKADLFRRVLFDSNAESLSGNPLTLSLSPAKPGDRGRKRGRV